MGTAKNRETTDLAFAAWAHMNGLRIIKASEFRKHVVNEYRFTFADPDDRWDDLFVRFTNSEAMRFDNSVRALKKLCKRDNGV